LFIELSSPPAPASFHFHTTSRAEAQAISDAIGEIAGAVRATGLREVAAATGSPPPPLPETSALAKRHKREDSDGELLPDDDGVKRGVMLYDFEAQGDDELGVRQDQIVEIVDDSHEEWWKCRAGGQEGVVPASYVEVIKTRPPSSKKDLSASPRGGAAALASAVTGGTSRSKVPTSPTRSSPPSNLSKPDPNKIRTWTDRTGSYKVEAQFLGYSDGEIQLHKLNGVKISVSMQKMSLSDVQYVERIMGQSTSRTKGTGEMRDISPPPPKPPPESEKPTRRIEFDWFSFFLESGVDYNVCQRYAIAFERDQMDESILPDINAQTLRTLGVREGDILRIMKRLDEKFGRIPPAGRKKSVRFGGEQEIGDEDDGKTDLSDVLKVTPPERKESLFSSGPGGALRNNTTSRRGRPTAGGKQAPGQVDGAALSSPVATTATADREESPERERIGVRPLRAPQSRLAGYSGPKTEEGFEDDAWAVKKAPATQPEVSPSAKQAVVSSLPAGSPVGSAIHDLASISSPQPTQQQQQQQISLPPPLQPQPAQLSPQNTISPVMLNRPSSVPPTQAAPQATPLQPHYTGIPPQPTQSLPSAVPQPTYTGPTPAQASGDISLSEQLAQLQIYRQQQQAQTMMGPLQTATTGAFNPAIQQVGYVNGSQPQQVLTPQQTGYMANFLPPGQQNSVLGPTRSFSVGLPPPLIPTNTAAALQLPAQSFVPTQRTGPANFSPTTSQFLQQPPQQQPVQPQQTGFQAQPQPFQPQPTGFPQPQQQFSPLPQQQFQQQPAFQQPAPTGFQARPSFLPPPPPPPAAGGLIPQQTGFQQQMLPKKTGSTAFKPVSFGTETKPLVPTRTGRRANLAAASTPTFAIVRGLTFV